MDLGTIAGLWRYPVKGLKGEPLARTAVLPDGIVGDRTAALLVETATHRRAGKSLRGKEAWYLHLSDDPAVATRYAADENVVVTFSRRQPRWFDYHPISIVFDLWHRDVEALVGSAFDPRRWRPNLYVTALPGFERRENDLSGATLYAGDVELRVVRPSRRCVTPNYDLATGEQTLPVLETVARERNNQVGIYCDVVTPGELAVGDALRIA